MAKVISFISRKGGTGKTTNAICLATWLTYLGKKTLVIETDPNFTISAIRELEIDKTPSHNRTMFDISASDDDDIVSQIGRIKEEKKYDYIIVDSAGKTTDKGIKELALNTDLIIITSSISKNDLIVTYQTVKDLEPAKILNQELEIYILPNRIDAYTSRRKVRNLFSELKISVFSNFVPSKASYTEPSTIYPISGYKKFAKEFISIING